MRLIITRHGETLENIEGIMQGHLPGRLSPLGIEQARKLANRLKDEKIDYIFSSDLKRAADTAIEIAKYHPKARLEFVMELRERNLGDLEGRKKSDFGASSHVSITDPLFKPNGGESQEELYERGKRFLHGILGSHKNDNVLFVSHNGIAKAIICAIYGKPAGEIQNIGNLDNTSVNIFEIDENRDHRIHMLNCTKHLC